MAMINDDFSVVPIAASTLTAIACAKFSVQLMGIPANGSGVVMLIIVGIEVIPSIALGILFFRPAENLELWICIVCIGWLLIALIGLLVSSLMWLVVRFV